jgi:squalene-hopene/tetraprenyl-beta-curcumene cyclase
MNIDFYVYSLKLKARLSKNKIKCELDFVSKKNAIENSIGLALEFLVKEQEPEGQWKDSPVNTWVSGYWTTGYVLNALQFCFHPKASNIKKDKAIEYLENKNTSVWGYVKEWIEDADSTNFALLGLLANQIDVRKEVDNLLTFQMADGGVTTYNNHSELLKHLNDPNIKNVKGWTQSHVCVSVGTLLVLGKLNGYENIKEQLIKYLLENKVTDCLWASHWWTSPIYSTSLIIEASLHYNHPELNKAVSNSLEKLVSLQGPNGCYSDEFNEAHPFYTALVLNALCSDKKYFKQYEKEVTFMASWMLRNQNEDGSWDSSYALRVPAANVLDSSEIKNWKKSDLGENVIIEDIHRIITTSTAISALSRYEKCQN